jgi:hypothetical protein
MARYARVIPLIILLIPIYPIYADSLSIYASVDCYITNWDQGKNFHSEVLRVSREKSGNDYLEARAIIGFDLTSLTAIPKGSKVSEANLILKLVNGSKAKVEVWELAREPDIFKVSWLKAGDEDWITPGGDLLRKVGEAEVSTGEMRIDLRDYIQAVVNGELNSTGWFLLKIADEGYLYFYSELSTNKPIIEISYTKASLDISLDSNEIKLSQGSSALLKVQVSGYLGSPVSIEVEAPSFLKYNISPNQGLPTFVSTLNLSLPEDAPGGVYTVIISAVGPIRKNATLKLTVIEKKGYVISCPSFIDLISGFRKDLTLRAVPTGNFSGEIAASILEAPNWLNVSINPSKGKPPFNFTLTLKPLPDVEASGKLKIVFRGQVSKQCEIEVRTRIRRVAIYSNDIDWKLSKELIISYSNSTGVPVHRVNDTSLFSNYDMVIVLGGHRAPTDKWMPKNVASSFMNDSEKASLERGKDSILVRKQGSTIIVIIAGKTRQSTAALVSSDKDGDGFPLIAEILSEDPMEVAGSG